MSSSEAIAYLTHCIQMHYIPRSVAASTARGLASGEIAPTWADLADHLDAYPAAVEHALLNA